MGILLDRIFWRFKVMGETPFGDEFYVVAYLRTREAAIDCAHYYGNTAVFNRRRELIYLACTRFVD
jgi:hypothetical protein